MTVAGPEVTPALGLFLLFLYLCGILYFCRPRD
jgi:hypothetical protein